MHPQFVKFVLISRLLFYPLDDIIGANGKIISKRSIDTDLKVPGCGKISKQASSRIVNGNPSPKWYPWVTFMRRYVAKPLEWKNTKKQVTVKGREQFIVVPFSCTASIISKRSILTAAHCLCNQLSDLVSLNLTNTTFRPAPLPWLRVICLEKNINQHVPIFPDFQTTVNFKTAEELHEKSIMIDNQTSANVPGFNEITVRIGSKDFHEAIKIAVAEAYVFSTKFGYRYPDLGLIITKTEINMQGAYPEQYVSPICLPTINTTLTWKKVTMVGWGIEFNHDMMKLPPSEARPVDQASNSSCMSNQAGVLKYRFQFCDLDQIVKNNYECIKSFPPNQPPGNKKKCETFWEQAEQYANQFGFIQEFAKADQIHIFTSQSLSSSNTIVCYKEEDYMINGWCKTKIGNLEKQGEYKKEGWGICSDSCKFVGHDSPSDNANKSRLRSSQYHGTLSYLLEQGDSPRNGKGYACKKRLNWARVCVVGFKPKTNVWQFYLKDVKTNKLVTSITDPNRKPFQNKIAEYRQEYQSGDNEWKNYQAGCNGDSGAAMWTMDLNNDNDNEMIATQVAVFSSGRNPCGHQEFAEKITDHRILKWIAAHWQK